MIDNLDDLFVFDDKAHKKQFTQRKDLFKDHDLPYVLFQGDCLQKMDLIPNKSVDLILCDLPYGTTSIAWDAVIPFNSMWNQYKRLIKNNGSIVLFCSQPFTSELVMSNPEWFKYEWIWEKSIATGFFHAHNAPMKKHENILVFSPAKATHEGKSNSRMNYYPQDVVEMEEPKVVVDNKRKGGHHYSTIAKVDKPYIQTKTGFPTSILKYDRDPNSIHPTQKPVDLLEYLIKTYTKENQIVLDNTAGSFSCGEAAINTNRRFIGIERDPEYFKLGLERVINVYEKNNNKDIK